MLSAFRWLCLFGLLFTFVYIAQAQPKPNTTRTTVDTARPWAYWWWMGSAVTEDGIRQNLQDYAKAGLGGVHIIPIYGVKGYEKQFVPFMSDRWLQLLEYTLQQAATLRMGVDLTLGTGWPYGGPQVTPTMAAQQFQVEEYPFQPGQTIRRADLKGKGEVLAITAIMTNGDTLVVPKPFGPEVLWQAEKRTGKVYVLRMTPTGQQVKRAAPGGEGPVLDHFDTQAVQTYLQGFTKLKTYFANKPDKIRAVYNDSYEAYGANWTPGFLNEFKQRRGYDLRQYLPVLQKEGQLSLAEKRVLGDYHATIADLLRDAFTKTWTNWAKQQGYLVRNEAHGSPGNLLDLYALSDMPETEYFGSKPFDIPGYRMDPSYEESRFGRPDPMILKFASSSAHVAGKPLVTSETSTWLADHFKVSLAQIKPIIDESFISGINHVFYHGIPYSPPGEAWPGWLFYASTNYNQQSHFWRDFPELNRYITDCQRLLQTGKPDGDVLLYFPIHDLWHSPGTSGGTHALDVHANANRWLLGRPIGQTAADLQRQGFQYDYISDLQLTQCRPATNGSVTTSGGANYKMIVVPPTEFLPLETLQALDKLAKQGVKVLFVKNRPSLVAGYHQVVNRQKALETLNQQMASRSRVADDVVQGLNGWQIRREPLVDNGLAFIRKKQADGWQYFVANLQNKYNTGRIRLAVNANSIELVDPLHQRRGFVPKERVGAGMIEIPLTLAPGESVFINAFESMRKGSPWPGQPLATNGYSLTGNWLIRFIDGAPFIPKPVSTSKLVSWTTLGDTATQWFSGTARYSLNFTVPDNLRSQPNLWLDLGDVREVAEVRLNGQPVGKAWSLPYRLPLPNGLLKQQNTLEVDVRNLSFNRMRYLDSQKVPWRKFYDINMVDIQYKPFDASKRPPVESGLLGPVQLVGEQR
ncbi:glycosyl hydrolase [Nibrella saemangeumensis]